MKAYKEEFYVLASSAKEACKNAYLSKAGVCKNFKSMRAFLPFLKDDTTLAGYKITIQISIEKVC